jgi:two-component system, OmpR family, sensor histidine kinase VicK
MKKSDLVSLVGKLSSLSSDGMFLYSIKGKTVVRVNEAMASLFDISHEAFLNQPAFFVNHILPEDIGYLKTQFDELLKTGVVENVPFKVRRHDSSVRHITASSYKLGDIIFGIFRDVTKERENETYIVEYGARKDTLLDMVAHNLCGPLNLMQSFSQVLESAVAKNSIGEITNTINFIKQNTNHCLEIVNDFLEEEHLVSERVFVKVTRFDMIRKVKVILERTKQAYPSKKVSLLTDQKHMYINSDEVKFFQVIHNLVSNAVKFTTDEGVVDVEMKDAKDQYLVSVKDNGIGIPDSAKDKIFVKYTPAGRPGLRGERSLGMGLYIASRLTELMKGTISFESTEGKGSTFVVQLPKAINVT